MKGLGDILGVPGRTFGTWSQIHSPELIDMLGLNGFDFIVIDCQHGPFGIETAERMARAAAASGLAAAVRVSRLDEVEILKALDSGISHVIVPDVASAAEAGRAVAATRFAPHGTRGACPCVRSGGHFVRDWRDYAAREEARTGVVALVESVDGMGEIEAIAATPGLAALMAGPFDLSVSMGLGGDWRAAPVREALRRLVAAGRERGLPVVMPVFSPDPVECRDLVENWAEEGVSCFMLGSDKILIANAFGQWIDSVADRTT
ncbi:aldolase/citrate lyase family protein [Roseibacterium sp. SDUM158017]|uniref:HpcH/HpaI aldolase family protein n=1 Tax=Roseicyclus salinarum TaxID=3036773 RepID=UPI00241561BE|nr:aldolase/citrate lyase family protein [Roseibacterium sp. SDUM158017]MDG4648720.1 aldolase/citrate lyase family protein [Roseibacterium sp. SDUM158017]